MAGHASAHPLGRDHRSCPANAGHTLIELLVAVIVLGLAIAFPVISLIQTLGRAEARASALVFEGGVLTAQAQAIWSGSAAELRATAAEIAVEGTGSTVVVAPYSASSSIPTTNVRRWADSDAITIRFLPGFGVPDGAGSVFFGREGIGERVIVRLESGLTRRTRW